MGWRSLFYQLKAIVFDGRIEPVVPQNVPVLPVHGDPQPRVHNVTHHLQKNVVVGGASRSGNGNELICFGLEDKGVLAEFDHLGGHDVRRCLFA